MAAPRLIAAQVTVCRRYVEAEARRVDASEGFERMVAESRLSAGRATLQWLSGYLPAGPALERNVS